MQDYWGNACSYYQSIYILSLPAGIQPPCNCHNFLSIPKKNCGYANLDLGVVLHSTVYVVQMLQILEVLNDHYESVESYLKKSLDRMFSSNNFILALIGRFSTPFADFEQY